MCLALLELPPAHALGAHWERNDHGSSLGCPSEHSTAVKPLSVLSNIPTVTEGHLSFRLT